MMKTQAARNLRIAALLLFFLCLSMPGAHAAPLDDCAAGRHQYIETRRIAATAMQDGEVDFVCGVCGREITETLFATNHLWGDWITDKPPTCTEPGARHRICTRGQRHKEHAASPALGHSYNTSVAEPGCEEEGVKTFACVRCDHSYTERIPPIEHDYRETIAEPSCLEPGLKTFTCANDPSHTYDEEIPAIGSHDFGEWHEKIPAGEGAEGQEIRVCARCGFGESRMLAALPTPEPPEPLPVMDIVLVSASTASLGFFAFLLIPYFLCLAYIKRREKAVERRDALLKEWEAQRGFE